MSTYNVLLQAHSGFRYVVLLLVIIALVQSLAGWLGRKAYTEANRKINLFAMISVHIQFLIGIILYFFSPYVRIDDFSSAMKDDTSRYWTAEHGVMMLVAVILFTLGHSFSKKAADSVAKHRHIAIYYAMGIIIVIAAIVQSGRPLIGK